MGSTAGVTTSMNEMQSVNVRKHSADRESLNTSEKQENIKSKTRENMIEEYGSNYAKNSKDVENVHQRNENNCCQDTSFLISKDSSSSSDNNTNSLTLSHSPSTSLSSIDPKHLYFSGSSENSIQSSPCQCSACQSISSEEDERAGRQDTHTSKPNITESSFITVPSGALNSHVVDTRLHGVAISDTVTKSIAPCSLHTGSNALRPANSKDPATPKAFSPESVQLNVSKLPSNVHSLPQTRWRNPHRCQCICVANERGAVGAVNPSGGKSIPTMNSRAEPMLLQGRKDQEQTMDLPELMPTMSDSMNKSRSLNGPKRHTPMATCTPAVDGTLVYAPARGCTRTPAKESLDTGTSSVSSDPQSSNLSILNSAKCDSQLRDPIKEVFGTLTKHKMDTFNDTSCELSTLAVSGLQLHNVSKVSTNKPIMCSTKTGSKADNNQIETIMCASTTATQTEDTWIDRCGHNQRPISLPVFPYSQVSTADHCRKQPVLYLASA